MNHPLYSLSQGAIRLLVFVLLSARGNSPQAQTPGITTTTQHFSGTGQIITWTLPTGVTSLIVERSSYPLMASSINPINSI